MHHFRYYSLKKKKLYLGLLARLFFSFFFAFFKFFFFFVTANNSKTLSLFFDRMICLENKLVSQGPIQT